MGIKITGTLTWQHVNTPASDPQILKSGGVSKAKIKTTWEKYSAFCKEHDAFFVAFAEDTHMVFVDIRHIERDQLRYTQAAG